MKGEKHLTITTFKIFLTLIWIYLQRISLPFKSEQRRETSVDYWLKCLTVKRLTITLIHLQKQTFPWAVVEKILGSVHAVTECWNE